MVSYNPVIHKTAQRELAQLPQPDQERLKEVLRDVAATEEITNHPKTKPLEGQRGMHRVRVNDIRAVVELHKPRLYIYRVGHRANVYEAIDDEIEARRATV